VGHYGRGDEWHGDSDHPSREAAARRCAWLNGSGPEEHELDGEAGEEGTLNALYEREEEGLD